jgi:hypothetical protein
MVHPSGLFDDTVKRFSSGALSTVCHPHQYSRKWPRIPAHSCHTFPICALAHLQLGRAYALSGDMTKAKTAYQDFLTLWKDADPDIPILNDAKAEYGKLQ